LASAYDDNAVAASVDAMRAAHSDDLALLAAAFAETDAAPTDPLWRKVATQIARHRLYTALAVVFLAVVLFMSPVPLPVASSDEGITALLPTFGGHDASPTTTPPVPDTALDTDLFEFALPEDNAFAPVELTPVTEAPET